MQGTKSPLLVVLMPVYNDWRSSAELIRRLDRALSDNGYSLIILLIDDASIQHWSIVDFQCPYEAVLSIRVLRLRRNLGHQRAIAVGLAYIEQNLSCDAVLVMDADGEDTPEGALELLRTFTAIGATKAIFAERSRRSESLVFRCFYWLYKLLHRILTGIGVKVGNFSILPGTYLGTLVVLAELWNHYAAAVFRSKLPLAMIPIPRGYRIEGKSTMNFVALVAHGLSAISVFGDIVGVRLLITAVAGSTLTLLGILVVASVRVFTKLAIPGWATYASGILAIICMLFLVFASASTFLSCRPERV